MIIWVYGKLQHQGVRGWQLEGGGPRSKGGLNKGRGMEDLGLDDQKILPNSRACETVKESLQGRDGSFIATWDIGN